MGVVGAGGGPDVVGIGGSGLDAGLTGSTTGLPSGCAAVRGDVVLLPFDCVLLCRFFALGGCGAVEELPVLDAVDPALVDPDVFEPELCPCIASGVINAKAIRGIATLP